VLNNVPEEDEGNLASDGYGDLKLEASPEYVVLQHRVGRG